jgi:ubiquinol oxidase
LDVNIWANFRKKNEATMGQTKLDLKREQQASMARPGYKYSLSARFFFLAMDLVTGRKTTLAKAKLLEMLASIPYREWETHQYRRLSKYHRNLEVVQQARQIVTWGREAQDNEYWHLLVIQEKMNTDGLPDPWYVVPPISWLIVWSYRVIAGLLALVSQRRAFLFNAEFEDHAEHSYAQFVSEHSEWETQPVQNALVKEYSRDVSCWADVFRRIGLDERDHRNRSFVYSGKADCVVRYEGMPELDPLTRVG